VPCRIRSLNSGRNSKIVAGTRYSMQKSVFLFPPVWRRIQKTIRNSKRIIHNQPFPASCRSPRKYHCHHQNDDRIFKAIPFDSTLFGIFPISSVNFRDHSVISHHTMFGTFCDHIAKANGFVFHQVPTIFRLRLKNILSS